MEVINIEKIDPKKVCVWLGRTDDIICAQPRYIHLTSWYPAPCDHFIDYPSIAKEAYETALLHCGSAAIATQSIEFLDVLLNSDFDFQVVTVRKGENDKYHVRVLSKAEALDNRRSFNMELRI